MDYAIVDMSQQLYDTVILGAGPAGFSAALSLARVEHTTLIPSGSTFRNEGVEAMHRIHGYLGTTASTVLASDRYLESKS